MRKKLIIAIAFVLMSSVIFAESPNKDEKKNKNEDFTKDLFLPGGFFNINYALGFGVGNFNQFISTVSYRGFDANGTHMVNAYWGFGGGMGWTGFEEKFQRATYQFDQGAITGVGTRTYYNLDFYISGAYHPLPEAVIKPYIGLNAGPVYQTIQTQIGQYYVQDQNWQFKVSPEIGLYIPFGKDAEVGFNTGIRYNLISYNNIRYNLDGISYFQWIAGLSFLF